MSKLNSFHVSPPLAQIATLPSGLPLGDCVLMAMKGGYGRIGGGLSLITTQSLWGGSHCNKKKNCGINSREDVCLISDFRSC